MGQLGLDNFFLLKKINHNFTKIYFVITRVITCIKICLVSVIKVNK